MEATDTVSVVVSEPTAAGFRELSLQGRRGTISAHWYESAGSKRAAAFVGGVGGDFDTPARDLYPRLCRELPQDGLHGLRVQFRDPLDLAEATFDLLTGIAFLEHHGVASIGLVGHSFGGAVVIRAAVVSAAVTAVVGLAAQAFGADVVHALPEDVPLLLVHGAEDTVLPPSSSRTIHDMAHEPKRLTLHGAGHGLDEVADEVHDEVREWLVSNV